MTYPCPQRIDIQGDWPSDLAAADIGIIIIDHGSRREESNQYVITVARDFQKSKDYRIVEPAHMLSNRVPTSASSSLRSSSVSFHVLSQQAEKFYPSKIVCSNTIPLSIDPQAP